MIYLGEWIACQAAADRDPRTGAPRSLWVGVELRCDRVHDMLCQGVFSASQRTVDISSVRDAMSSGKPMEIGYHQDSLHEDGHVRDASVTLDNLAYIGGDAVKILSERIPSESITAIFINHPEPPERSAGGEGNNR